MDAFEEHARSTYELLVSYIKAGFTAEQAFELVKIAVTEDYRRAG